MRSQVAEYRDHLISVRSFPHRKSGGVAVNRLAYTGQVFVMSGCNVIVDLIDLGTSAARSALQY
jgi:hypothetical protein